MQQLQNYILGSWITGDGDGQLLFNAVTGNAIATASTKGINFADVLNYARNNGNTLRQLTFTERGLLLKALALHLRNHLPEFYAISYQTGATKADSWVDIEGGIGNLFSYASLRRKFADLGGFIRVRRDSTCQPVRGCRIHPIIIVVHCRS